MAGLNLEDKEEVVDEEPPKAALARDKLLEEVRRSLQERVEKDKAGINLVVIGQCNV